MKLDELRQNLRHKPMPGRSCTICNWKEETRGRPAKYVATSKGSWTQWYDCGEHPDEPNGAVESLEDIGKWLARHGLDVETPEELSARLEAEMDELERAVEEIDGLCTECGGTGNGAEGPMEECCGRCGGTGRA